MRIGIIYWSGSGNTEKMAQLIEKGAAEAGAEVTLRHVSDAAADNIEVMDIVALGSPAIGDEGVEESEMEPFVSSILPKLTGKKAALFGSCGWGDGEWMRKWAADLEKAGVALAGDCLTIRETPEGESAERCVDYGRMMATVG